MPEYVYVFINYIYFNFNLISKFKYACFKYLKNISINLNKLSEYTKLMAESREQAIDRMIAEAKALGANAIIDVRFSTSYIMKSAAEILVYGTAVFVE